MKIDTKYHERIEVTEADIWHFENGIPGFRVEKQFIILPLPDNEVFHILQSVRTPDLAFVIMDPFLFYQNYEFKIDDSSLEVLDIKTEKDVQVFVILNVQNPFEKTTVNLLAPIICNVQTRHAKQIVLHDTDYKTKHTLYHKHEKVKG